MNRTDICILCPNGCEIRSEVRGKELLSLEGNGCPRGEEYVRQELTAPKRTISTSILVENGEFPIVSVRLTRPIPLDKIFPVMEEIKKLRVRAPKAMGDIVLKDVCGLGSDVMITKSVAAK